MEQKKDLQVKKDLDTKEMIIGKEKGIQETDEEGRAIYRDKEGRPYQVMPTVKIITKNENGKPVSKELEFDIGKKIDDEKIERGDTP